MKRLTTLVLALCLVLGSAVSASALEVQVSGFWDTAFIFDDNLGFSKDDETDHFKARSRFRPQIEFIASENLRAVLQMESRWHWGDNDAGNNGKRSAALDTNGNTFTVRRAYIDWNVADTSLNVKMGLQNLGFPSAVRGNPFFSGNVAGVIAGVGINDNVTLNALWARPWMNSGADKAKYNQTDIFGIVADFNFDPVSISPWIAYSRVGNKSGFWEYGPNYMMGAGLDAGDISGFLGWKDNSDIYAGGIAAKFNATDRLSFALDAIYAKLDNDGRKNGNQAWEGDGYYVALAVDYAAEWGTPGAFAWFSSGDSKSDRRKGKFGRLPAMGLDDGVAFTRMGFMGAAGLGTDTVVTAVGAGTWGVGLQIADLSFVEKLSHTARVAYYAGTNAKYTSDSASINGNFGEAVYMTKDDWAVEVNLDSTYQIYDGFSVVLELGWIHMDIDKKNGFEYRGKKLEDENAYNANFKFRYSF